MARSVYQYRPINDQPDVALGISLPFGKAASARPDTLNYASGSRSGGSGFVQTYSTEEQAVSNLKNLLLTTKGERVMQPRFGTSIRTVLFENNTSELRETLLQVLEEDIAYWLPYIQVNDITVTPDPKMHTLTIALHFKITTIGSELVINILASENEFSVGDATIDEGTPGILVETGTVGADTFGGLGEGGGSGTAGAPISDTY